MNLIKYIFFIVFTALIYLEADAQGPPSLLFEPFQNRVFIEERGQFSDKLRHQGLELDIPILYGLENAEFNAYFTSEGVIFRYAERKVIPKTERVRIEGEPEERGIETIWHTVKMKWVGAGQHLKVASADKVHEYYNYTLSGVQPNINFVPAYNELRYESVYPGVDAIFELPDEGGIKYRFEISAGSLLPDIQMKWEGVEDLGIEDGNLMIKSKMAEMVDKAPTAFTDHSGTEISAQFSVTGNIVSVILNPSDSQLAEGIIIDPWITNTSYPDINRAHDVQEDAAGNVVVQGNHTNFQVQKFNSAGVLQWTYITNSTFLGDIAVDDPGNVYIVGGYSAGKRQKLNPAGVQQWVFAGLVEEWRLAFNYSKTVLTIGGYFINPGGNNLARFDVNTGAISNQIVYGEETRSIATDCNGDMYSLHVTFGPTGVAASNTLRKTNADFTPAGSVPSGFLLSEVENAAGYVPNPTYSVGIFQGFNGLVVSGLYVYMSDGATIRRVNKNTLNILNSTSVPGGAKLMNSGMAADHCGNIYVGSQTGIIKFDSTLNFIESIPTPGAVYDIIYGQSGELVVCGAGFVGSYPIVCDPPPAITATTSNACDGTGSIEIAVAGGLAPYTYEWQPGGQTTNPISGLSAGVYTYTVNDAFCRTYIDSVEIYENPTTTFTATGINSTNVNPGSVCLGEALQFGDNSTSNDGNIVSWEWDFGDGNTSMDQTPTHTYTSDGVYDVELIVTTDLGCVDSLTSQVTVDPLPSVDFAVTNACFGDDNAFTDASTIGSGTVASWDWDFGDGGTSTLQNPTYAYSSSGTYQVSLVAASANGCSDSFQSDAESYALPQADFTYPSTCVNDPTDLFDASTNGDWPIDSWQWTVEGQSLQGQSGQHTFSTEGVFPVQLLVADQFGCADSVTHQITISERPQIQVAVNDDCAGEQFVFTNTSSIGSGSIDVTDWDMGDGNTYSAVSPTNTYVDPGTYNVTLHLESDLGCAADTAFQVVAFPNPVAGLTWQNACEGTSISLTETTSVSAPGQLIPSDWNMGDGTVLNDQSVTSYDYPNYGDYTIQLSVETQDGCTDSESFVVSSHAMPVADFAFTNICETDSVLFFDQSVVAQGNLTDWQWTFGNGQSFSGANPGYQSYPADGFYPVQLTTTSDSGCVHIKNDTIEVFPAPIADFAFDSVCYPLSVQFTDLSDPAGAYSINQWAWEFSDGQTSFTASPAISFPQFGAYGATLVVTNQAGCKDEISFGDALVHPLPIADYVTNLKHCFLQTMSFSDESTLEVLSNDAIVSWVYDFGDGNSDSAPNGSHDYVAPGFYDLELTVTTNHGCEDTELRQVEVFPLPDVSFDANPKEGCDPLFVQFQDQTSITAPYSLSTWQWDLGDNSAYPSSPNPYYVYDTQNLGPHDQALYDVSLVVTSGNGCVDSISLAELITVHPVPVALFSSDPDESASIINPIFEFTDLSTDNVTGWQWTFGDGGVSTIQHPEHTYLDTGTYRITLAVLTDFGCADTISYTVMVEPEFTFYIPNAFTPNDDRVNDLFFGTGQHLSSYNMKIFNRWGEMIFESNDPDFKWDGTFKGAPVEAGEYVYQFNIVDWDNHSHQYNGGVMLLR